MSSESQFWHTWTALPHSFPLFPFHTLDQEERLLLDGCSQMALHKPGTSIHLHLMKRKFGAFLVPSAACLSSALWYFRFSCPTFFGDKFFFIVPAFQPQWPYLFKSTPGYQSVSSLHSRNRSFIHVPDISPSDWLPFSRLSKKRILLFKGSCPGKASGLSLSERV